MKRVKFITIVVIICFLVGCGTAAAVTVLPSDPASRAEYYVGEAEKAASYSKAQYNIDLAQMYYLKAIYEEERKQTRLLGDISTR